MRTVVFLLLAFALAPARAVIYQNPITIDGTMTDWTTPANILTNTDQSNQDGQGATCPSTDDDAFDNKDADTGTCVGISGSANRDLNTFAFTYDLTYLYIYVERATTSNNVTDWWFFVDTDNDTLMESTDIVYRVKWQGSNRNTDKEIWNYSPVSPVGDPLVGGSDGDGDGYTMPGSVSLASSVGSATGGSADGLAMELSIPWTDVCGTGCGPRSIGFHIASSNGTNLPNNIIDNMSGPTAAGGGGSGLVFLDLSVAIAASATDVGRVQPSSGTPTMTFTVTVTNEGGGDASDVEVQTVLAAGFEFVSADTASYDPGSGDSVWNIASLPESQIATLHITVRPTGLGAYSQGAAIIDLNEADTDSGNDVASPVSVTIREPDLRITKSHAGDFALGYDGSYSLVVSNTASAGGHTGQIKVQDSLPAGFSFVGYSGTGWTCSQPSFVECAYGNASTVLSAGGSLPVLIIIAHVDSGSGTVVNSATVVPAAGMNEASGSGAGDNTVTDGTVITTSPVTTDLSIQMNVNTSAPAVVTQTVTYTVTVVNNGPAAATNVSVTDLLPSQLTFVSAFATTGSYNSVTGVWTIANLANTQSATLTLNATANSGSGGVTVINNAFLSALDQIDTSTTNNAASIGVTPVEQDLTTSTKSVADVNGGKVNPGDRLDYTITLRETGGVTAANVRIYDDLPSLTGSLQNLTTTSGTIVNVAHPIDITNITVPANGTVTITYSVLVNASAPAFGVVQNSVTIEDPPRSDIVVSAPPLTVRRGLIKPLYLRNSPNQVTRVATTSTTAQQVAGNASVFWVMSPAFAAPITIEDVSGGSIPVQLAMTRPSNGSKSATVSLFKDSDGSCDGSGGTQIATSGVESVLSATAEVVTFPLDLAADVALAVGDCLYLEVHNNSSGKVFSVLPYSTGTGDYSKVDLSVYNYINIDSIQVFDASDTGRTTPLGTVEGGTPIVIRSRVSDPFGDFDITSAKIKIIDADLATRVSTTEQIPTWEIADSDASTRTFEYAYALPTAPAGTWKVTVEGVEGLESSPIDDSLTRSFVMIPPQPNLVVDKKIFNAAESGELTEVSSQQVVVYAITVTNDGDGAASNVVIEDELDVLTALGIDEWLPSVGGPFKFEDGAVVSGYSGLGFTWQYSIDDGVSYLDPTTTPLQNQRDGALNGFDGGVTNVRIIMPALPHTMNSSGASFTVKYIMQVK